MSHFYTVVLVNKDTQNIEDEVEKLLAPYNENIKVEEYDRKCYCINSIASSESWKMAEEKHGSFDNLRNSYWKKVEQLMPSGITTMDKDYWHKREEISEKVDWKQHVQHFTQYAEEKEKAHPAYQKPDPKCSECKGSGTYKSTYNPDAKWDWWVIGGRWDGTIKNNYQSSDGGFNFGAKHHGVENNTTPTSEFLKMVQNDPKQYPYALITPRGEWCEKGKMGWFGMSSDEKNVDTWHSTVQAILKQYENCVAVGCDLHI